MIKLLFNIILNRNNQLSEQENTQIINIVQKLIGSTREFM